MIVETKKCSSCRLELPFDSFAKDCTRSKDGRQYTCRSCKSINGKKKYAENPSRYAERIRSPKSVASNKASAKRHRVYLREEMFKHYGYNCACCGEDYKEFLTLDHINGGGAEHSRSVGGRAKVLPDLNRRGWPSGFQILCWNCNCAKQIYGICPHKTKIRLIA